MSLPTDLITATDEGLYCQQGGFHIDPWRPVKRAIITHGHADHARRGSGRYLTSKEGRAVLRIRLGEDAHIETLDYGEGVVENGVSVSLHPAGHILGSAQVRLEYRGRVWVASGDYKLTSDETCTPFEPVRCHVFISECTFGLPVYRWPSPSDVFKDINRWWSQNRDDGAVSVLFAYALGKAQRIVAGVDASIGPIYCHGAVQRVNAAYRGSGRHLPTTTYTGPGGSKHNLKGALVVAPPSAMASRWMRRFGKASTAFASGWMRIRGVRRRRSVDRGFVLSDHADWDGLITAMRQSGAERVLVTHGRTGSLVRWLRECGWEAASLQTAYMGDDDDADLDEALAEEGDDERDLERSAPSKSRED